MTLSSAQRFDLTALTLFSLAACVLFIAVRCVVTFTRADVRKAEIKFRSQLGQIGWDFTQNFATSTGVIGSVLTLILASGALPSQKPTRILPAGAYAGLAVFFGTLVIIAPVLYNGTATRVNVSVASERDTGCEYRGRVWGFLLAAVATEWGLLGSISTVFLTLLELYEAGSLPGLPVGLLSCVLGISVLAFARYSWLKIDGTIRDQFGLSGAEAQPALPAPKAAEAKAEAKAEGGAAEGVAAEAKAEEPIPPVSTLPPPKPRLTLL
jgi:hypothetical protein